MLHLTTRGLAGVGIKSTIALVCTSILLSADLSSTVVVILPGGSARQWENYYDILGFAMDVGTGV